MPPLQDYSPGLVGIYRSPGCEQFNRDVLSEMPHEAAACLVRHSIAACGTDRVSAEMDRASVLAMFTDSSGPSQQVRIVDPLHALCAGGLCAPIIDGTVMFSDAHYLSEAGSLKWLPVYSPALQWSLDADESVTSSVAIGR